METQTRYTIQFATNDSKPYYNKADFSVWLDLASKMFDCFTWYEVKGVWKGDSEISYKVEIIPTPDKGDITGEIFYLARYIKGIYNQKAVLVSTEEINVTFI